MFRADPSFESRLRSAYQSAQAMGLFANAYAMENVQEYWAEGVQDWYYTNLEADPPNGIHNFVDRREELQAYDPTLYGLIAEFLPDEPQFVVDVTPRNEPRFPVALAAHCTMQWRH